MTFDLDYKSDYQAFAPVTKGTVSPHPMKHCGFMEKLGQAIRFMSSFG